ncbi:HAD-IA family hydrolase [Lysinibacter sp. HNR]|uniref:HAD family hydrolase n=1 Tax=Lysinibacter sp. HNR TaxID=3031408 RepID=UPI0024351EC5|nr:HAD-IA family hydrolase [Lysinibacter sp. HNR]WGD36500.1 HAD-IA family hydrolase [Lysinibacter sp. HNR]
MIDLTRFHTILFDLDGVLTPTAEVHRRAWQTLFTRYFERKNIPDPYQDSDYFSYLDGKPRYEGVESLLESRSITLPWGTPSDSPDAETVCGLGNRKNVEFSHILATDGVNAYPGSLRFLNALAHTPLRLGVVSSSKNAEAVLGAAGLRERFPVVIDGVVSETKDLPGKPQPDTFEFAARLLDSTPQRSVVVEDAISGIQAGRTGDFGLVIGVDRGVGHTALLQAGADIVVSDLDDLVPSVPPAHTFEKPAERNPL